MVLVLVLAAVVLMEAAGMDNAARRACPPGLSSAARRSMIACQSLAACLPNAASAACAESAGPSA